MLKKIWNYYIWGFYVCTGVKYTPFYGKLVKVKVISTTKLMRGTHDNTCYSKTNKTKQRNLKM